MSFSQRDAQEMISEMGFCSNCHDHTPCGCEKVELCDVCGSDNTDTELLLNDGACFNCNTQLN